MDAVESGETVVVARNGHPGAELRPVRRQTYVPVVEVMRAFHGLPRVNYHELRAAAEALLGEDHLDA